MYNVSWCCIKWVVFPSLSLVYSCINFNFLSIENLQEEIDTIPNLYLPDIVVLFDIETTSVPTSRLIARIVIFFWILTGVLFYFSSGFVSGH